MNPRDLTNHRFSHLLVTSRAPDNTSGRARWCCLCDCGNTSIVAAHDLKSGNTKSCGCLKRQRGIQNLKLGPVSNIKHGLSHTNPYKAWVGMWQRCTNPNCKSFKDYGARGITVDPRWKDYANFIADMGLPPPGRSLDRIDNDAGYSKANCRWATPSEQLLNRRPRQPKQSPVEQLITPDNSRANAAECQHAT